MPTINGVKVGPNSPAIGLRANRSEADEEQLCDDLVARIAGSGAVVKFSQAQRSQQTRGIADRRYRVHGAALWFEVKAANGKLTMSQHEFLLRELEYGALACCGTLEDLQGLLVALRAGDAAAVRAQCLERIGEWVAKGYRPERPTRRGRR
jgi:hypothetical protein